VRHIHRSRILHEVGKKLLLGVKKAKIILHSPKTVFRLQNQEFYREHGKIYFWWSKRWKKSLQSPKSVCSCDISIDRKFYMENEKIYFWGQKGENKLSVPKNGIWGPKSI
jgi:hypothetical protein